MMLFIIISDVMTFVITNGNITSSYGIYLKQPPQPAFQSMTGVLLYLVSCHDGPYLCFYLYLFYHDRHLHVLSLFCSLSNWEHSFPHQQICYNEFANTHT